MGHAKLLETVSIAQSHAPALLAHFSGRFGTRLQRAEPFVFE
jgi:hypothetical protein